MNKKIGIWGLGIVGKSAVSYFHQKGYALEVLDQRTPTPEEQAFLAKHQTPWFGNDQLLPFLERNDLILPSCGIDLRPHTAFEHKWLAELDLFGQECKKPIIAITGSVGKTTVTHLLSHLLIAQGKKIFTGGNIGVGLLESIDEANTADFVVIEVSSFQLERCKTFSPDFAICTNIHANHLDRHGTLENYVHAKLKILGASFDTKPTVSTQDVCEKTHMVSDRPSTELRINSAIVPGRRSLGEDGSKPSASPSIRLKATQDVCEKTHMVSDCEAIVSNHPKVLFPLSLVNQIPEPAKSQPLHLFATHIPSSHEVCLLGDLHTLYYLHNSKLIMNYQTKSMIVFDFKELPFISYEENVVILASILHMLGFPFTNFVEILNKQELPEHRLEKIATIKEVDFYNDSKATIPASTLAAIEKIKDRPIVLFLGGVSKGVDRADFVKQIGNTVRFIYCFGKEAEQLKTFCDMHQIPAQAFATLDDAFATLPSLIKTHDQVLFSPAGASYDLFANYAERGNHFKKLVMELLKN